MCHENKMCNEGKLIVQLDEVFPIYRFNQVFAHCGRDEGFAHYWFDEGFAYYGKILTP